MKTHVLKCWPEFFQAVKSGKKPFEVRKNDREYSVGDLLELHEYDPETSTYTSETPITKKVTYILSGEQFVIKGMVLMGLEQSTTTEMEDALCTILKYMVDNDAGSFEAECSLDTGVVATLEIAIVSLKNKE